MPKRHIRMISAAVAVAIPLGAAVCGAVAPSAQAQTITVSPSKVTQPTTKPVVGVNLYVNENYSLADTLAWGERDLTYIHDTLGLNAVAIDWDYNVPSQTASVVQDSPTRTPTISDIKALTDIAKSLGMRVEYRVLFAINNKDNRDDSIVPKNFPAWLSSLLATETPALRLAQTEKVPEFVAGSEMASIDQRPLWRGFFRSAARIYKGILSYATWGGHTPTQGFFSGSAEPLPSAEFGATAYPQVNLGKTASVASLTKAWESYLTAHTPAWALRRTAIDEIGIPALAGAYADPWLWDNVSGTADPTVQARWFQAACAAVTAEHMRGIYFWSEPLNDDPANPFNSLVGFLGRPASLAAIESC
jgi:hypothetical protein